MTRYRMYPSQAQYEALLLHCAHARFVWNLAVEQQALYVHGTGRKPPTSTERFRQLTEARADNPWLAAGSVTVQQQALRDFDQAMRNFFGGTHRRPSWRKRGMDEGFRIVGGQAQRVERINRKWAKVLVPKVGWVKFRLGGLDMPDAKSYRVTMDRAGRWHISFAVVPDPIPAPGTGEVVGVDRGVVHAAVVSDGTVYDYDRPDLDQKVRRLQRQLSRCKRGSNRRAKVKARLARAQARRADARKDFVEKATTDLASRFDLIRLEALSVRSMTRSAKGTVEAPGTNVRQKAGLNRSILDKGWGFFAQRLGHKALGRVEYVPAAYTSQRCSVCGHVAAENRESQAVFRCVACGHTGNADLNAAKNIAAGHAVTARGGSPLGEPSNREPLHLSLLSA